LVDRGIRNEKRAEAEAKGEEEKMEIDRMDLKCFDRARN
jgi:hypothetical protein